MSTTTRPHGLGWADVRRADGDPRPPGPLVVSVAFGLLLAWIALGSVTDLGEAVRGLGVLVIVTVSAWWLTVPAAVALGVTAFLFIDGFVQGSLGQLTWDGPNDLVLLLACLALPALAAELGFEFLNDRIRRRSARAAGREEEVDVEG